MADDDAKAIQELAVPAAAWIDYQLVTALGANKYLTSTDAQSWALFEAGSDWFHKHDNHKASRLYEKALQIDPDNVGALANLGLVRGIEGAGAESIELLRKGLSRIEAGEFEAHLNPDWYRVKFNLAAFLANWGFEKEEEQEQAGAVLPGAGREGAAELTAAHGELSDLLIKALRIRLEPWRAAASDRDAVRNVRQDRPLRAFGPRRDQPHRRQDRRRADRAAPTTLLALLERDKLSAEDALAYALRIQGRNPETGYNIACAQGRREEFSAATTTLCKALGSARTGTR